MLDESPVHKPSSSDIFNSCRRGDLDRVRYIQENSHANRSTFVVMIQKNFSKTYQMPFNFILGI